MFGKKKQKQKQKNKKPKNNTQYPFYLNYKTDIMM